MPDANLQHNQPLARAAFWFLWHAIVVLVILCFALFHAREIADGFNHPVFLTFALAASIAMFSLLTLTSSALGFLSNCPPGRFTGVSAIVVLLLGWTAISWCYYVSMHVSHW